MGRRTLGIGAALAAVVASSSTAAAPSGAAAPATPSRHGHGHGHGHANGHAHAHAGAAPASASASTSTASSLPAPSLSLAVTPGSAGAPWKLRIENRGEVPVRVAADPRLLSLEITPPASPAPEPSPAAKKTREEPAPKTVRCVLPGDARPSTDEGRELVVPGKRAWSASFDPLFYCFGAKERAALETGASVVARFGWPPGKGKPSAPYAAAPVGAAVGKVSAVKEIASAPFTLSESVAIGGPLPPSAPASGSKPTAGAGAGANDDAPKSPLSLSISTSADVARGVDIPATVTATNERDRSVTLLFRPDTLTFRVSGPAGSTPCNKPPVLGSPIRELYGTIAPKGRASLTVLVTAFCDPDAFDEPGVYRVFPILDTTGASGKPIGLQTWDGEVQGRTPMLVRVRNPRRPAEDEPRPTLDAR